MRCGYVCVRSGICDVGSISGEGRDSHSKVDHETTVEPVAFRFLLLVFDVNKLIFLFLFYIVLSIYGNNFALLFLIIFSIAYLRKGRI